MPDQIPPECAGIQSDIDNMKSDLAEYQWELRSDPDINKTLLQKAIAKLNVQIAQAEGDLATCIANHPLLPPPLPIPAECNFIKVNIDNMDSEREELKKDVGDKNVNQELLAKAIRKLNLAILDAENALKDCIAHPPKVAPLATKPVISTDTSLQAVQKVIAWSHLQKKFDEVLNNRTDPSIFTIRVHNHAHFNSNGDPDDQPATDVTVSMIEAEVVNGQVATEYKQIARIDLGLLPFGYYVSDFNVSSINLTIDPSSSEPIKVKVSFECGGTEEIKSTTFAVPNFDLVQFDISIKFSFDVFRTPKPVPPQCVGIESNLNNMKSDLAEYERELKSEPNINKVLLQNAIAKLKVQIAQAEDELAACVIANGGLDPTGTGRLNFLSWVDDISRLEDDAFDEALKKYIVVHIVTTGWLDPDGTFQKAARNAIYGQLKAPATNASLSTLVSNWILGGTGLYDVASVVNDGQYVTINYLVPANKLDPFPDNLFKPQGWPSKKLPLHKNLREIEHIVVLTMENRSFDHMLGYLSLQANAGGMGRKDVHGLSGNESNSFENQSFPSFAHNPGDTAFPIDPSHSYEPVFRQINADLDDAKNAIPGTGKMDGFVKSLAIDKFVGGAASTIMGYQPAVNVPVYDALVRDFGISDYWFAAHPGPTFSNRFYELTGRLNLGSGLNNDNPKVLEDMWEFSNSSPLTPVFNKTIFDHLTNHGVSWKYYEHVYCFLRFFSKYTFDSNNVFDINDPLNGFFTDAKNGTLPSVSYIDPHFIELPPGANCDGPVADIKPGQDLVQRVVEAVITGPKFGNTLLIILYDEHGGFFDHMPPPAAVPFSDESPIKTYGVRVPAFFISPWVRAGSVHGRDADPNNPAKTSLYFDSTSILKTIATRFMNSNPPYLGARYAAANDLSAILSVNKRKFQFLPFVRYNLTYVSSEMLLDVLEGVPAGPVAGRFFKTRNIDEQSFSFEQVGKHVYIRSHIGNMYITVDIPDGNVTQPPPQGFGVKLDSKYDGTGNLKIFKPGYQRWKFTPLDTTGNENLFIVTNDYFPNKILKPLDLTQNGTPLGLITRPKTGIELYAWRVTLVNG